MTDKYAEIVRVRLEHIPKRWAVATCEQIPGLFISHPEIGKVLEDIPVTIRALFKAQYGKDVVVVMLGNLDFAI